MKPMTAIWPNAGASPSRRTAEAFTPCAEINLCLQAP
jgi:hypothetical protein